MRILMNSSSTDKPSDLSYLYRFRSLDQILDKKELENQEIYFAPPEKLNDPVEGFLNIFWEGDKIVWKNLFKNYLISLEHLILRSLAFPDTLITTNDIQMTIDIDKFPTEDKDNLLKICSSLFKHSSVDQLICFLDKRKNKTKLDELKLYLREIHDFALELISQSYTQTVQRCTTVNYKIEERLTKEFFSALNKIQQNPEKERFLEKVFNVFEKKYSDNILLLQKNRISKYDNLSNLQKKNIESIVSDFPNNYIDKLKILMHPPWYSASFTKSYSNELMWKTYGSEHTGICLKFKTEKNTSEDTGITLQHNIKDYNYRKEQKPETIKEKYTFFPFKKVIYQNKHSEINFFESLGALPQYMLDKYWFTDETGNSSKIVDLIQKNKILWRDNYQKQFYQSQYIKLKKWRQENEYRLVLSSFLTDLKDDKNRTLKYEFSSLEGIIFGIKTPLEAKLKIKQIISDKYLQDKKNNFHFYQAYYNSVAESIEAWKINRI